MKQRRYLQVDVFAERPGAGNPLAVVLDCEGLADATMQAIARWTRLPETTFVFAASSPEASYAIRIFSPRREVPFAGHPSVGTAHVVLEAGFAVPRDGVLWQQGVAGLLPLSVIGADTRRSIAVRTPRARVIETTTAANPRLRHALRGLELADAAIALADGGRRWWLVPLRDEAAVRSAQPFWGAISSLAKNSESMGVFVYAPADAGNDYDLAVRAFVGAPAQFEDAASGAANATLAAWLATQGALPGHACRYRVSQGREVGYDAILELQVDADGDVWSGGRVVTVVRGMLDWVSECAAHASGGKDGYSSMG